MLVTKILLLLYVALFSYANAAEEKKIDQKAIANQTTKTDKPSTITPPAVINVTGDTQRIENPCKSSSCDKEPEQSWWHKLWTDPVATFTGALFLATAALIGTGVVQWFETRSTARRQLRAYVAVEDIFFIKREVPPALQSLVNREVVPEYTDNLAISIQNYGHTPAFDVQMWRQIIPSIPSDEFNYPYVAGHLAGLIAGRQMVHPTQSYIAPIGWPVNEPKQFPFGYRAPFNVYGRIVYRDIYGRWWKTTYGYTHEGHSRFTPDRDYNQESGPYKNRESALEL